MLVWSWMAWESGRDGRQSVDLDLGVGLGDDNAFKGRVTS